MEFFHSDRSYEHDVFGIDIFCLGLVAALKLRGVLHISANTDEHASRIKVIQSGLQALHTNPELAMGIRRLPLGRQPLHEFTAQFSTALLEMEQIKVVEHLGPYFLHLEVSLTEEWSRDILGRFSEPEQTAFCELADAYLEVDEF